MTQAAQTNRTEKNIYNNFLHFLISYFPFKNVNSQSHDQNMFVKKQGQKRSSLVKVTNESKKVISKMISRVEESKGRTRAIH